MPSEKSKEVAKRLAEKKKAKRAKLSISKSKEVADKLKIKKEERTISKSREVEKKLKSKKGVFKAKVKRYYNTPKKGIEYIRYYKTGSEMNKSLINHV